MRIVVLTPYFGGIDHEHAQCMRALLATPAQRAEVVAVELPNCPWIDQAFAYLVDTGMSHAPDVLFFIEHDMLFDAKDVVAMSERLLSSSFDVLGAAYSQRRPGGRLVGEIAPGTYEFFKPGLVPANMLALGFTALRPSIITALRARMRDVYCPAVDRRVFPYFAHEVSEAGYLGQDLSFFRRVKNVGGKLALDLEPRVFHKGSYRYALEDTGITVPRYAHGLTMNVGADDSPKAAE